MVSLNHNVETTYEKCGTQTTKLIIACHKKRCAVGTLHWTQRPKLSTKCDNDLNYHNAKKNSRPKQDVTFFFILCYQEFPRFHVLRKHEKIQHGYPTTTSKVVFHNIINQKDYTSFSQEFRSCQSYLVDSEFESVTHKFFKNAVENLNETLLDEKPPIFHLFKKHCKNISDF